MRKLVVIEYVSVDGVTQPSVTTKSGLVTLTHEPAARGSSGRIGRRRHEEASR
jgi:hypothetical protein